MRSTAGDCRLVASRRGCALFEGGKVPSLVPSPIRIPGSSPGHWIEKWVSYPVYYALKNNLRVTISVGASLAQSAARQSHNLKVVSSSLTGGTFFFSFDIHMYVLYKQFAYEDSELGCKSAACSSISLLIWLITSRSSLVPRRMWHVRLGMRLFKKLPKFKPFSGDMILKRNIHIHSNS